MSSEDSEPSSEYSELNPGYSECSSEYPELSSGYPQPPLVSIPPTSHYAQGYFFINTASFRRLFHQRSVFCVTFSSKRRRLGDLFVKKASFGRLFRQKGVVWATFSSKRYRLGDFFVKSSSRLFWRSDIAELARTAYTWQKEPPYSINSPARRYARGYLLAKRASFGRIFRKKRRRSGDFCEGRRGRPGY